MKKHIIIVIKCSLVLLLIIPSYSQVKQENLEKSKKDAKLEKATSTCTENADALYNRHKILEQLANILNKSVPAYSRIFKKFAVKNERGNFFFIYDLTTPSNKSNLTVKCIDFKNNHIYHFAPYRFNFSYSHILILEEGKLKVFKSIDCWDKGDKLEDVISYVKKKLENDKDKDEILKRVKNFRKHGQYFYEDQPLMPCTGYNIK